jgi:nucleoside-diphosphate-sugar epimerase
MTTGSKVVVYGGSGFLGSHVADALTDAGYAVRTVRPR